MRYRSLAWCGILDQSEIIGNTSKAPLGRLADHVLAVGRDVVLEVGEDGVITCAAGDPVLAAVARVDHVVARAGVDRVGLAAAALGPELVVAVAAEDRVRARAAFDAV